MSAMIVTAPNGVRVKVSLQKQEVHKNEIPVVRNTAGDILAPARTEEFMSWVDFQIEQFASETRAYELDATTRILVEDNPA